jgi:hypothetical protein
MTNFRTTAGHGGPAPPQTHESQSRFMVQAFDLKELINAL